jgi:hypothetical protein
MAVKGRKINKYAALPLCLFMASTYFHTFAQHSISDRFYAS